MSDSTVENLMNISTVGNLQSGDLFYVFRSGSPDSDFKASATALLDFVEDNATAFADAAHVHTLSDITDAGSLAALSTISTTQITNDAVTYAKIQNVSATNKILGRATAGSGDVEEITCTATARSLLDDTSIGAMRTTLGLATIAVTGAYSDLSGAPTLGVLAAKSSVDLSTGDATGTLASSRFPALTGDITTTAGAVSTTIAANAVTNAKAAQMAANTIKGNNTGSTANAADLNVTQVTAMINAMVGDSGSGGTKGLVPAPSSGDAAAGKFLKADGTFAVPAGGSGDSADTTWFGDGSDGNVTVSSGTTTLTRDTYYNNLTISGTGQINNGGFRIFVKGTLTLDSAPANAIISIAANNGTAGTASSSGGAGASGPSGGTIVGKSIGGGGAGQSGGNGAVTNGVAGTANVSITAMGGYGGGGGNSEKGGNGSSGTGATLSANTALAEMGPRNATHTPFLALGTVYSSGQGGAGGSGGGGDGTSGGGGGSGGAGANPIVIHANTISRTLSTAAGAIAATAGNGGTGGTGSAGNRGGGMGGCGGGGAFIYIVYKTLSGTQKTGAITANGGNGGNGGTGTGTGTGGYGGAGGKAGMVIKVQVGGSVTATNGTRSVSPVGLAGGANSGTTAGSGTAGETLSVDL